MASCARRVPPANLEFFPLWSERVVSCCKFPLLVILRDGFILFGVSKGPKPIDIRLLTYYQTEWLSLFRLLENGRDEQQVLKEQEIPHANYEKRLRDIKRGDTTKLWIKRLYEIRKKAIKPEPQTLEAIFTARTHQQIRSAWKASKYLRSRPSSYPCKSAVILRGIREGKKYRFPTSDRETSSEKRLIHFASALAGIECGISAASAIDKLRKLNHGRGCPCAPCVLERESRIEEMTDLEERQFRNEMESNPPLGVFYLTLPPREIQRRSKRRTPTLTKTGGFVMES